jgi:hypothetical protein
MINPNKANEIEERWKAFRILAPYFGKVVSARFIQKTEEKLKGLTRIHNLIEGIYKPSGACYGFAIASMLKNPYADKIAYNADGSWFFSYSPKSGALDSAVNQSLFNCEADREPVLVLKQLTNKSDKRGTTYKILGLGLIESFDMTERLFRIRELTIEQFQRRIDPHAGALSDDLIETALQLQTLEKWSPYVAEERAVYRVSRQKRDDAFRRIVLENYDRSCAVLGWKFEHEGVTEVQAAHIIGKEVRGTDDPRNGMALSHTAHWAFDEGLFTITDQYEVLIHPKALAAKHRLFPLMEKQGQRIALPAEESNYPHSEALAWHRDEVFGKFARRPRP